MKHKSAFTLVELAIVIVIIGLLVGGVLQGQELIKQARIRSDIKRLTSVEVSIATFYGKYTYLPGDFPAAQAQRFLGFPANTGGDGNGKLEWRTYGLEDAQFVWRHLDKARLLNVSNPDCTPVSVVSSLPYYAGFKLGSCTLESSVMYAITGDLLAGHPLGVGVPNLGNIITIAARMNNSADVASYPSDITRSIDEKLDDGKANTGKLKGTGGRNPTNVTEVIQCANANGIYNNSEAVPACRILYDLGL